MKYKLLKQGEVLKKGDEAWLGTLWRETTLYGNKTLKWVPMRIGHPGTVKKYRRPIKASAKRSPNKRKVASR